MIDEHPEHHSGGWYNTRCQYRSVAFGTWKVGGARQLFEKLPPRGKQLIQTRSLDANRNYLMQSAFDTIQTRNELHDELNMMDSLVNEAYSIDESNSTQGLDRLNGNAVYGEHFVVLQQQCVFPQRTTFADANRQYASLSRSKRERLESSMQRVHQRSRSAGNDMLFTVLPSSSTGALKGFVNGSNENARTHRKSSTTNGSINALKATKKFFKKIYDSATLPGRAHTKASSSNIHTDNTTNISSGPFFEICYSSNLNDEERYDNELGYVPSLVHCVDHDSTPSTLKSATDDPMNDDSILTKSISSNDSQKTSSGEFHSWAEVFDHLKQEMKCMRERDAQILADLQMVEIQLRNVKNRSVGISKSDYTLMVDRNKLKLGDLVESMPL
uniref:Schwannomin interacting protein 1 C-terminal domain-containing protein n=2 Tax=Parascaris univalens TaxID=6257 RepID=A0A915AQZ9_PARUN